MYEALGPWLKDDKNYHLYLTEDYFGGGFITWDDRTGKFLDARNLPLHFAGRAPSRVGTLAHHE